MLHCPTPLDVLEGSARILQQAAARLSKCRYVAATFAAEMACDQSFRPLDGGSAKPLITLVSRQDGLAALKYCVRRRGKSGLHGSTVPDNRRRGRPQGQCNRKQTAPRHRRRRSWVRVKGCGKSAPRLW